MFFNVVLVLCAIVMGFMATIGFIVSLSDDLSLLGWALAFAFYAFVALFMLIGRIFGWIPKF